MGILLGAAMLSAAGGAWAQTPAAPAPPPPACTEAEHRQFDFWVGSWDVFPTGRDKAVAKSLIEGLYGGCAVRENWMPFNGNAGGSLNHYDRDAGKWHQTWMDSANGHVEFQGGMAGEAMVLTGLWKGINGPGKDALVRMTYSKAADGSVRQFGEASTDEGKTWAASFDFTYRRAAQ